MDLLSGQDIPELDLPLKLNPADLTFHVVESEATIVEFNLADLSSNQTDEYGDWWDFIYWDYSGDGYFSSSDYYEIRTNSSRVVQSKRMIVGQIRGLGT